MCKHVLCAKPSSRKTGLDPDLDLDLDLDPPAWHLEGNDIPSAYRVVNFKNNFEFDCLITKSVPTSRVKCKHILCLLFAYFAISAGAEIDRITPSGQTDDATLLSYEDKTTHIPSSLDSGYNLRKNELRAARAAEVDVLVTDPQAKNHPENTKKSSRPLQSSEQGSSQRAEIESEHFISHLFSRYSDEKYLLIENLEMMLENIGLLFPGSISELDNHDSIENDKAPIHIHDHSSHHHKEHVQSHNANHFGSSGQANNELHRERNVATGGNNDLYGKKVSQDPQPALSSSNSDVNFASKMPVSVNRRRKRNRVHEHDDHSHCMSTQEILQSFGFQQLNVLSKNNFLHLCPALIDQLDAGYCKRGTTSEDTHHGADSREVDHDGEHVHHTSDGEHVHHTADGEHVHHTSDDEHEHDHTEKDHRVHHTSEGVSVKVWSYAFLSVAVISLCSLAGIVVIPNMKRTFYNHTLQFLVALAVGAMLGDAMLHLLPHALLSESHHDNHHHHHSNDHRNSTEGKAKGEMSPHMAALYKGLVALLGIYCFFFLERLFTLFTKNRSGRRKRKQKKKRCCPDGVSISEN